MFGFIGNSFIFAVAVGATFHDKEKVIKDFVGKNAKVVYGGILAFAILFLPFYFLIKDNVTFCYMVKFCFNHLFPVVIILFNYILQIPKTRLLSFIGGISYEIYIVHSAIIGTSYFWWTFGRQEFLIILIPMTLVLSYVLQKSCSYIDILAK